VCAVLDSSVCSRCLLVFFFYDFRDVCLVQGISVCCYGF